MAQRRMTRSGQTAPVPKLKLKKKVVAAEQRDAANSAKTQPTTASTAPPEVGRSVQLPGGADHLDGAPPSAFPTQTPSLPRTVQPDEPWQALLFSRRERRGAAARRAAQQAQRETMSAAVAAGMLLYQGVGSLRRGGTTAVRVVFVYVPSSGHSV